MKGTFTANYVPKEFTLTHSLQYTFSNRIGYLRKRITLTEQNNFMAALNPQRYQRETHDIKKTKYQKGSANIDCYTVKDAIDLAHKVGLMRIQSDLIPELCNLEQNHYTAKATVYFTDGTSFDGIGDANLQNVNTLVGKHLPRMAETRAVGRALGKALNLDANFFDEFGGEENETPKAPAKASTSRSSTPAAAPKADFNAPPSNDGMGGYECEECFTPITDSAKYTAAKKAQFSLEQNGKILCWNCNKKHQ